MPKIARELSAMEIRRIKHPGGRFNATFAAGGVPGLLLQVTPSGAKSWVLRTRVAGRRRNIGLGGFGRVGLAEAREMAREMLATIAAGRDPIAERKAARAANLRRMTFGDAIDKFLETKLREFRSEKHAAQWPATLNKIARPVLGNMPVDEITAADVRRVLVPIWSEKTETASRLRGRIEAVLAWATVSGFREGPNPARWTGNLDHLLPAKGKVAKVEHFGAIALADLPDWIADLRTREGMAARALEFAAMTAARSGEVRGATWDEIDLDRGLWIIPAGRMKAGNEHRVPLTPAALALLQGLPRFAGSRSVFPGARGGPLSDMSLSAVMRQMHADKTAADVKAGIAADKAGWRDPRSGRPSVPHGLRSSFRDWCAENGVDHLVAELCLAHRVGSDVERAYRRSDLLERRLAVMAAWGRTLNGEGAGVVVALRGAL